MTEPSEPTPIVINSSQVPEQLATAVRYVVASLGGYAVGQGWINDQTLQTIVGIITFALPLAWGMYSTYENKRKLVTVAAAPNTLVSDSVIQLKKD